MWYKTKHDSDINLSMPIIAERRDGEKCLLVPQMKEVGDYTVSGFNWLSLKDGTYGSASWFNTAKAAMDSWSEYNIYNAVIDVSEI